MSSHRWAKTIFFGVGVALFCGPPAGRSAAFTTKLQAETVASWQTYVDRFENARAPAGTGRPAANEDVTVVDLNPAGQNAGSDVPNGYIHHWVGSVVIPQTTVAAVRAVLENYREYPQVYAPDVREAGAKKEPGEGRWDVRLVTEQVERFGLHFAFDVRSHVEFRVELRAGGLRVDSRSYLIRESDSGRAPYTDLLPEGEDHGILWRLNSYWRVRQRGTGVEAECQVISLSRKPLPGMREQVKDRAKASLRRTMEHTVEAVHPSAERV